jgi:hypothetical protein
MPAGCLCGEARQRACKQSYVQVSKWHTLNRIRLPLVQPHLSWFCDYPCICPVRGYNLGGNRLYSGRCRPFVFWPVVYGLARRHVISHRKLSASAFRFEAMGSRARRGGFMISLPQAGQRFGW